MAATVATARCWRGCLRGASPEGIWLTEVDAMRATFGVARVRPRAVGPWIAETALFTPDACLVQRPSECESTKTSKCSYYRS